jgi:sugar phosphate permease
MDADRRRAAWQQRIFLATYVAYAGYYFGRKPFYVVKGTLTDELHWSPDQLATIGASYLVAYALGQFAAGTLGTWAGPRVALLLGMGVSVACNVGFGLSSTLSLFAGLMFVNGVAQATGWGPCVGTMAAWFPRKARGTLMGFWSTQFTVGAIAANALASWVLGHFGWRWSFATGALVLLGAAGVVAVWQRDKPEDVGLAPVVDADAPVRAEGSGGWSREMVLDVALMGGFYFFVKFIRYALWSWVPWVLQHDFSLAGDQSGYLSTAFDIAGAMGAIVCGYASDRWLRGDRHLTSLISIGVMTASAALLMLGGSASLPVFVVGLSLVGFTLYGPDTLISGTAAIEVGDRRTAVLAAALINGMGSVGSIVQELVLGRLLGKDDLQGVFVVLFTSATAAMAMLAGVYLRHHRRRAK